jgi:hypothetical protein
MSNKDATPSLSPDAAIPEHLRGKVRVAAEWRVVNACKTVTVPQNIDTVCDAVHDLDGFDSGDLPAETLIELGKEAIDWWMPDARPHTTEPVAFPPPTKSQNETTPRRATAPLSTKTPWREGVFVVAGAGFEPATFGL